MSRDAKDGLEKRSSASELGDSLFAVRQAFGRLEGWVLSAEALALPEDKIESEIEDRGREVCRLMLQAHLKARGRGELGPALEVRAEETTPRHKAGPIHARLVTSIFGDVRAERRAYSAPGQASLHPLDEDLHLPRRSYSYELQRRVVEEVLRGPFDEAVESVEKGTGVKLPKRSAEQLAKEAARDFDAFYAQRARPAPEGTAEVLVASVDGKGVPLVKPEGARHRPRRTKGQKANKKKMATVAAVFTQAPRVRTPEQVVASLFDDEPVEKTARRRPEHKRVWASLEKSKDRVLEEVAAEVEARDPQKAKTRAALTDGERALQMRVRKFLPDVLLILDFLHVLEKLWAVGHALFGEGTEEAVAWVRSHARMVLEGKSGQVVKGMRQSVTKRRLKGAKRKVLLGVAKYLYRNRERMRYDEYPRAGLPIASGAVEGACKHLVKDRMERSGMRWRMEGAEAVLPRAARSGPM